MGGFTWDEETLRYARIQIGYWSWRLIEELDRPAGEREDFAGDMWLDVAERAAMYNGDLSGQRTFVALVVGHKYLDLLDSWMRGKNKTRRRTRSLNRPVVAEDDQELEALDLLSEDQYRRAMTGVTRSFEDDLDNRVEIARRMAGLADEMRAFAERLGADTVTEIARSRGVSRSRVIRKREALRKAVRATRRG